MNLKASLLGKGLGAEHHHHRASTLDIIIAQTLTTSMSPSPYTCGRQHHPSWQGQGASPSIGEEWAVLEALHYFSTPESEKGFFFNSVSVIGEKLDELNVTLSIPKPKRSTSPEVPTLTLPR